MRKFFALLLSMTFALSTLAVGQNINIGEKAPDHKVKRWVRNIEPSYRSYTLIVFFHSSSRLTGELIKQLDAMSNKFDTKLNIVALSRDKYAELERITSPYVRSGFAVGADEDREVFNSFGVQYVPLGVVVDKRNRVVWMGTPSQLTNELLESILL